MIVRAPNILPRLALAAAAILTAAASFTIVFLAGIHATNATVAWAPQPPAPPAPPPVTIDTLCPTGTFPMRDAASHTVMCVAGPAWNGVR